MYKTGCELMGQLHFFMRYSTFLYTVFCTNNKNHFVYTKKYVYAHKDENDRYAVYIYICIYIYMCVCMQKYPKFYFTSH